MNMRMVMVVNNVLVMVSDRMVGENRLSGYVLVVGDDALAFANLLGMQPTCSLLLAMAGDSSSKDNMSSSGEQAVTMLTGNGCMLCAHCGRSPVDAMSQVVVGLWLFRTGYNYPRGCTSLFYGNATLVIDIAYYWSDCHVILFDLSWMDDSPTGDVRWSPFGNVPSVTHVVGVEVLVSVRVQMVGLFHSVSVDVLVVMAVAGVVAMGVGTLVGVHAWWCPMDTYTESLSLVMEISVLNASLPVVPYFDVCSYALVHYCQGDNGLESCSSKCSVVDGSQSETDIPGNVGGGQPRQSGSCEMDVVDRSLGISASYVAMGGYWKGLSDASWNRYSSPVGMVVGGSMAPGEMCTTVPDQVVHMVCSIAMNGAGEAVNPMNPAGMSAKDGVGMSATGSVDVVNVGVTASEGGMSESMVCDMVGMDGALPVVSMTVVGMVSKSLEGGSCAVVVMPVDGVMASGFGMSCAQGALVGGCAMRCDGVQTAHESGMEGVHVYQFEVQVVGYFVPRADVLKVDLSAREEEDGAKHAMCRNDRCVGELTPRMNAACCLQSAADVEMGVVKHAKTLHASMYRHMNMEGSARLQLTDGTCVAPSAQDLMDGGGETSGWMLCSGDNCHGMQGGFHHCREGVGSMGNPASLNHVMLRAKPGCPPCNGEEAWGHEVGHSGNPSQSAEYYANMNHLVSGMPCESVRDVPGMGGHWDGYEPNNVNGCQCTVERSAHMNMSMYVECAQMVSHSLCKRSGKDTVHLDADMEVPVDESLCVGEGLANAVVGWMPGAWCAEGGVVAEKVGVGWSAAELSVVGVAMAWGGESCAKLSLSVNMLALFDVRAYADVVDVLMSESVVDGWLAVKRCSAVGDGQLHWLSVGSLMRAVDVSNGSFAADRGMSNGVDKVLSWSHMLVGEFAEYNNDGVQNPTFGVFRHKSAPTAHGLQGGGNLSSGRHGNGHLRQGSMYRLSVVGSFAPIVMVNGYIVRDLGSAKSPLNGMYAVWSNGVFPDLPMMLPLGVPDQTIASGDPLCKSDMSVMPGQGDQYAGGSLHGEASAHLNQSDVVMSLKAEVHSCKKRPDVDMVGPWCVVRVVSYAVVGVCAVADDRVVVWGGVVHEVGVGVSMIVVSGGGGAAVRGWSESVEVGAPMVMVEVGKAYVSMAEGMSVSLCVVMSTAMDDAVSSLAGCYASVVRGVSEGMVKERMAQVLVMLYWVHVSCREVGESVSAALNVGSASTPCQETKLLSCGPKRPNCCRVVPNRAGGGSALGGLCPL